MSADGSPRRRVTSASGTSSPSSPRSSTRRSSRRGSPSGQTRISSRVALVRELKAQTAVPRAVARVCAVQHLPPGLRVRHEIKLPTDWSIFDKVFASAVLGERKPYLAAYEKVIAETGIDPSTAVFVDDKMENVEAARSLGIHGIVFDKQEGVFAALRNVFGDRVQTVQAKEAEDK